MRPAYSTLVLPPVAPARVGRLGLSVLVLAALVPGLAWADGAAAGLVVPVPANRIMKLADDLNKVLDRPLARFKREQAENPRRIDVFHLVLDFTPDGKINSSDNFGACSELARRLRRLRQEEGIKTIAWVHGEVSRHSVLPVLACAEIVLSSHPPASLGKVNDGGRSLDAFERAGYEQFAHQRRPLALIEKMYNKDLAVIKVRNPREGEDRYRAARPNGPGDPVPGLEAGSTVAYTFDQASKLGLCENRPFNTVDDVLQFYGLPRTALSQLPEHPLVWRLVLSGAITGEMQEKVKRHVRRLVGQKANVLIFQLECGDGDSGKAYELADFLAHLNDARSDNPVETIAYVTPQARNTAAFLAFACDRIVMHHEAKLGDFERYVQGHPSLEGILRKNLAELAEFKHYSPVLARGMLDRDLHIRWVASTRGPERLFLDEKDYNQDNPNKPDEPRRWKSLEVVKPLPGEEGGKYLTLDAGTAKRLGVVSAVVGNQDGIYDLVGVAPADVRSSEGDMLDDLAEFLRNPWTQLVLVMLGITCLILELKMPGASLPGVVSALCFVLFFWSHSQLGGQMTTLALLLFVLGLILLAMEIFVIPGFGVCGISGIVLVLGSLALVAYGHWPHSPEEWVGFSKKLGPIGLSMLGAIALAFLLARYLPSIPFANRLMLRPATEEGEAGEEAPALQPELAALLGAIGVAATPLRPAGKTQFGDNFVDVVAEGSYIQPGTRVQVIEIEGNRVVVKEV